MTRERDITDAVALIRSSTDASLHWDPEKRRFVTSDGKVVQQRTVTNWVERAAAAVALLLLLKARKVQESFTYQTLHDWASTMRQYVPAMHRAGVIVASGGVAQMTAPAWDYADERVNFHSQYLDDFVSQVSTGEVDTTSDAFTARTALYPAAMYSSYSGGIVLRETSAGMNLYKRTLDPGAEHCKPNADFPEACPEYAARGWSPIGSLPNIGEECPCRVRCRCHFDFKKGSLADLK
jgi:hypothetical protein